MKSRSKIFYTYAVFVIAYILLSLIPSPARTTLTKYQLNAFELRLLVLTLFVPVFGTWFAVFYGYSTLHQYSLLIKGNLDGKLVDKLAKGLFVLAIGLPLSSLIQITFQLISRTHPHLLAAATIVPNYVNVLYELIAFVYIFAGARSLNGPTRNRPSVLLSHAVTILVIAFGVILCDLISREHASIRITYHMSPSLVMLTLAIPYIYTWLLGLTAITEIYEYSKNVAGVVYRKGWNRVAFGLGAIVIFDILLQYLGTLSSWLGNLHLAGVLLLLYVLLFLLASGFIVVALGTRQLMKIEEV